MPTVAELDVKVDAKDDATAKLAALDALIKSMEGDDIRIDADVVGSADAELAALEEAIRAINGQDATIEVDADTAAAQRELAAVEAALQALSDETLNVNLDAGTAEAQLEELRARLALLGDTSVNVDLDAAAAEAKIIALELALKAIPDEEVTVEINTDKGMANLNRLSAASLRASGSINGIVAAALALGPALVPIGAVAVGAVGALGTGLSVAAIGAAAFAGVAITNFGGVSNAYGKLAQLQEQYNTAVTDDEKDKALGKMKAIMDSLTPAEQSMVKELQNFTAGWRSFASQFQPEIFTMATVGLRAMTALLPKLAPIFDGAVSGFHNLETAAIAALNGPFWQKFIANVGGSVQPLIVGLGKSIGNLITGFAGIINAFLPLSVDFSGGLEGMTASFARWATSLDTNQGFQNFVDYIRKYTPTVLESLASIGRFLVDLVQAAAPIGGVLLVVITKMLEAFSSLQNSHPILAAITLALLGLGVGFLKLVGPILAVANVFTLLAPAFAGIGSFLTGAVTLFGAVSAPVWLLVAAVAALVAGVIYAYTHFEVFRNIVNGLASALMSFAQQAGSAILSGLQAAWSWLVSTFGPGIQAVIDFVVGEFQKIVDWANQNAGTFATAWSHIQSVVSVVMSVIGAVIMGALAIIGATWNTFWPGLSTVLQGVWTVISGVISAALQIIRGIILVFAGLIAGDWSAVWTGLIAIFGGLWAALTAVVMGGLQIVLGLFKIFGAAVAAVWSVIWSVITSIVSAIIAVIGAGISAVLGVWRAGWNAVRSFVVAVITGIRGSISAWVSGLRALIAGFISAVIGAWNAFWSNVRSVTTSMIAGVRSAISSGLSSARTTITGWISAVIGAITAWASRMASGARGAMTQFAGAIRSGISGAVTAIRTGIGNMVSAVTGAAGRFLSAGASLMTSLVHGITSKIGDAVGAVRGAVGKLTDLLPGSPAKGGPLAGSGYAMYRGQHLSEDLAAGIASKAGEVGLAASDLADLMTLQMNPTAAFSAITKPITQPGAASGTSHTINLTVENGAVQVTTSGDDPQGTADALSGTADDLADRLLTALRRG